MTLPPERISIKRRRQDEPVDTLILDPGTTRDQKRRYTDFYFQRLRLEQRIDKASKLSERPPVSAASSTNKPARDYTVLGIPTIRSSAPGDEVKDFARYRAAQSSKDVDTGTEAVNVAHFQESPLLSNSSAVNVRVRQAPVRRRFHLTRDISSLLRPHSAGGIRRSRPSLRPPIATFIEHHAQPSHDTKDFHQQPPIDSIIELKDNNATISGDKPLTEGIIDKRTQISTFQKPPPPSVSRHGNSIRDDPSTWDCSSDQLANELAALAFDIDPADATEPPMVQPEAAIDSMAMTTPEPSTETAMVIDGDDDFVFETYVRVKHNPSTAFPGVSQDSEIGVLIIDDENEDLWEKYVHGDDDDDEWNDEDEDSNAEDNPRNEYPDDEVSTDDEHGRNAYKYRHNALDDEDFDESGDDWCGSSLMDEDYH